MITIIADTREKKNKHILDYCQIQGINFEHRKLNYGDYSIIVGEQDFSNCLSIERKGNLDELAGNFTKGRIRFKKEFGRKIEAGGKMIVVVEDGSIDDIANHKYISEFHPNAYKASIKSFETKFDTQFNFIKRSITRGYFRAKGYYKGMPFFPTQAQYGDFFKNKSLTSPYYIWFRRFALFAQYVCLKY